MSSTPDFIVPADPTQLMASLSRGKKAVCSSKVNLSGVNGNVIMSGWVDDNPDDEG